MNKVTTLAVAAVLAFTVSACDLDETDTNTDGNTRVEQVDKPTKNTNKAKKATEKNVEKPTTTPAQDNALRAAQDYLSFMPFSKQGLIDQLSSEYGDGYAVKDARWAVNQLDVDWNEQAAKAAQGYLDTMPFSRDGLIDQLSADYGDQFTRDQAVYGVDAVGL